MTAEASRTRAPAALAPVAEIDAERFAQLLTLAGPAHRVELLSRLTEDLGQIRDRILAAQGGPDWADLRAQTHVLVALAGATGATGLQHIAELLNQAAHDRQRSAVARLVPSVLAGLETLLGHAHAHLHDGGT